MHMGLISIIGNRIALDHPIFVDGNCLSSYEIECMLESV